MLATAKLRLLFLCPLLFVFFYVKAQFNTTPTVSYIDVNQGLSNNSVSCIYQDRKGFMWFGTCDGLNRYDGYKFTIFRNNVNDTNSILKNWVTAINEDEDNNLWVGTLNGLSIYEPSKGKFSTPTFLKEGNPVPQKIDFEITGVVVDKQHNKFIASHKGLFLCTSNKKPAVRVPMYANNKPVKDFNVASISFDSVLNKIWLYVSEVGLCLYNPANQQVRLIRAIEKYASCISVEAGKKVWVAANNKLYAYDVAAKNLATIDVANLGEVRCLMTDRSGILWIATNGCGIYFKRPDSTAVHKLLLGENNEWLENSAVFALYEDQDNRKWIGTIRAGIVAISQQKNQFTTIADTKPSNMAKNYMLSFLEDSAQNLWVATDGAGLRYWDRKKNTFTDLVNKPGDDNSIGSNNVTRLIRDHEGSVWAATWFGCVNRLNRGSNTFKRYHCVNPYSKTEDKNVWLLYEDRLQRLWASAWSLYRLNKTTDRFEIFDSSLTGILTLAEDNTGSLWGGSYTSLIKIDTLHKKHTTYAIGYPVRAIHQDKAGNFWIGTEGGGLLLFNRNTGHYTRATEENGLPNNSILNILEDSSGSLWLSTYGGLYCYNTRTKIFKNFTQADGLQSNQFSYNAALALSSGELVFGGIKGFNVFYPARVANKPGTHTVLVNSITIDNVPIEKNPSYVTRMVNGDVQELTVPYEHAVISVDFVTLDYAAADKIKYAYYMEGWDKGWNYMGNTRTANYSRLEPGSYTFKMKSTNEDGSWSTKETVVAITILPPWYKTWWAYFLYVLAVVSAIYLYIRYTKKQAYLNYEVQLAKIETEKERELNEKKLTFFTNVSHEFRTPLTLIINPINKLLQKKDNNNENPELNVVYRNARRLLSLTNQLLLFRKADSGADDLKITKTSLKELVNEVFVCFTQEAAIRNIHYHLSATQEHIEIYADVEKLEIAVFNLVSNAFKFTPDGGSISIHVVDKDSVAEVSVSDTGSGIAPEMGHTIFDKFRQAKSKTQKSGFGIGLYLVKNFIEKHGGKIDYESVLGKGTTFTIELLKGNAHFDATTSYVETVEKPDILKELAEEPLLPSTPTEGEIEQKQQEKVVSVSEKKSVLVVEDNLDIRNYLKKILGENYTVYEAANGHEGLKQTQKKQPDIIISDINMDGMDGMELCKKIKADDSLSHIPIVLLTGSYSSEMKLKGIENGADDYITKPFETDLLLARVNNILKRQNNLRRYFFDSITLRENTVKVPAEYQDFLNRCIEIVEANLDNDEFSIKTFCKEIGMSHSNLYVKVKQISGQTVNSFIRSIRLRRAAVLMLKEDTKIAQIAFQVGIGDIKYFREQFNKLFGMNPSDYVKKYKGTFNKDYNVVKAEE